MKEKTKEGASTARDFLTSKSKKALEKAKAIRESVKENGAKETIVDYGSKLKSKAQELVNEVSGKQENATPAGETKAEGTTLTEKAKAESAKIGEKVKEEVGNIAEKTKVYREKAINKLNKIVDLGSKKTNIGLMFAGGLIDTEA